MSNQIAREGSSMYIGFENIPFVFFSIGQTVHHTTISTRTTTISITGTEKRSGAKVHHTPTMREKKQKGAGGGMDRKKKEASGFFCTTLYLIPTSRPYNDITMLLVVIISTKKRYLQCIVTHTMLLYLFFETKARFHY